jgi:hypothetical protein
VRKASLINSKFESPKDITIKIVHEEVVTDREQNEGNRSHLRTVAEGFS